MGTPSIQAREGRETRRSTMLILNLLLGSGIRSLRAVESTSQTCLAGSGDQTTSPNGTQSLCNSGPTGSDGALMVRGCATASTLHLVPTPTRKLISTPTQAPTKAGGRRGRQSLSNTLLTPTPTPSLSTSQWPISTSQ